MSKQDRGGRRSSGRSGGRPGSLAGGSGARSAAASGVERVARVQERVRAALSDMILREEIREPAARGAIVSAVSVTRDLSLAKIYLRSIDEADEPRRRALVAAFRRAGGHIRHALAARIASGSGAMRSVPELRFAWDEGADHAHRFEEVLQEVADERALAEASAPPTIEREDSDEP